MKTPPVLILALCLLASCTKPGSEEELLEANSVAIRSVKVIAMPMVESNGETWDPLTDADLYVTIGNATSVLYKYNTDNRKENVQPEDLPAIFNIQPAYELPLLDQHYIISLNDYDDGSPDDFMAEVFFDPYEDRFERPVSKILSGPNVKVEVQLDWK